MKYRNRQTAAHDGKVFASKKEAHRYQELQTMQKMGLISHLECQPKYTLIPSQKAGGTTERAVFYIADFRYRIRETGTVIVEDVKGFKTKEYIIKRKLMLFRHNIIVMEK